VNAHTSNIASNGRPYLTTLNFTTAVEAFDIHAISFNFNLSKGVKKQVHILLGDFHFRPPETQHTLSMYSHSFVFLFILREESIFLSSVVKTHLNHVGPKRLASLASYLHITCQS